MATSLKQLTCILGPFHQGIQTWLSCQHPSETMHLSRHTCLCVPSPHRHTPCTWAFWSSSRAVCLGCSPEHAEAASDISLVVLPLGSWTLLLGLLDLELHLRVAGLNSVSSRDLSIHPWQVHGESPRQSLPRAMSLVMAMQCSLTEWDALFQPTH